MDEEAEFIRSEIPEVAKIVRQECWLEGERRGGAVDPRDAVIQERVAEIILNGAGANLRKVHDEQKNSEALPQSYPHPKKRNATITDRAAEAEE